MAAVTVVRKRENVSGSRRQMLFTINIANNGDTIVTGLRQIDAWTATSTTNNAIGGTLGSGSSLGTITLATGGAENTVLLNVIGF